MNPPKKGLLNTIKSLIKRDFNTSLTPQQEVGFQLHSKQFPALTNDQGDYDTMGFYQEVFQKYGGDYNKITKALTPGSPTQHIGTDRYKKPNHPTFSNESKYSIPVLRQGGKWEDDNFIAKKRNLKNMESSDGTPLDYFKRAEDYDENGIPDIGLKYKGKQLITPQKNMKLMQRFKALTGPGKPKKGQPVVNKYGQESNLLTDDEGIKFPTEKEHIDYYRKKALKDPKIKAEYDEQEKLNGGGDAVIALRGHLPTYKKPPVKVKAKITPDLKYTYQSDRASTPKKKGLRERMSVLLTGSED